MYLFFFLFVLFVDYTSAQSRLNRESAKLISTTLPLQGNTIKGYSYSDYTGKWNEALGEIPGTDMYLTDQNFKTMEVKKIEYQGAIYYIIYLKQLIKYYEYPELGVGYKERIDGRMYFYTEEEFSQIFNLTEKRTQAYGYYKSYSSFDQETLSFFPSTLEDLNKGRYYSFMIKLSEEGLVRFVLPIHITSYSEHIKSFETNYFEMSREAFYKWLKPVMPQ